MRYWVRWLGGAQDDPRPVSAPAPFQWWGTGSLMDGRSTICAVMDAESEACVLTAVRTFWPEVKELDFCIPKEPGWSPGSDRFPV